MPAVLLLVNNSRARIKLLKLREYGCVQVAWSRLYPHQTDVQLDLLESLLRLNPQKRLNVDSALQHP
jgi:hypothetical protein